MTGDKDDYIKGVYADLETLVQDRSAVLHALAWSGRLFQWHLIQEK